MLQKIDPVQLLTESWTSQSSGCLNITSEFNYWKIYFTDGDLKYVDCSVQSLGQLSYYLRRQEWNEAYTALQNMHQSPSHNDAEAQFQQERFEHNIAALQSEGYLDPIQTLQLLEDISQDALESFLWVRDATVSWNRESSLPVWVSAAIGNALTLDLPDLVKFLQHRLQGWQSCATRLWSPHQRPYILDYRKIGEQIPSGTLSLEALSKLAQIMRGLSLRHIALILKQDELHVAQLLSPYIQHEIIYLRNPQPPLDKLPKIPRRAQTHENHKVAQNIEKSRERKEKIRKIVCIDDSPTILNEIKRFLGEERYEITAVSDSVEASSVIFRIKPDLILLDISMPKINGYKLCNLLRSSTVFDETPIIMVTGNTGLIDKARAKLVGATDYMTKPFSREELVEAVEKYLNLVKLAR
jgi:twitching motility two-component system response regulator PilG